MTRAAHAQFAEIDLSLLGDVSGGARNVSVSIDAAAWARECRLAGGIPNVYDGSGNLQGPWGGANVNGTVLRCDARPANSQQPSQSDNSSSSESGAGDPQNSYASAANENMGNDANDSSGNDMSGYGGNDSGGNDMGGYGGDSSGNDMAGYGGDMGGSDMGGGDMGGSSDDGGGA